MKFGRKLILFMITSISIIQAFSRYYIVKSNFLYSIENIIKQNDSQYILERYMLESDIVKSIQLGDEITDDNIKEHLKNLCSYMEKNSGLIAVFTEKYEKICSNINNIDKLDVKSITSVDTKNYILKEIDNKHYMFFSTSLSINNKIIYIINAYDIDSIYEEKDRQMAEILFTDIIILIISTIIISVFSIFFTKPIDSLNRTTKKIASGKFNERVNIKSKDEIGELANSFNIMADQIEHKINELNLQVKQKNDFLNRFYT